MKSQAQEVASLAADAARSSERQHQSFSKAKDVGEEAKSAADTGLAAFRSVL